MKAVCYWQNSIYFETRESNLNVLLILMSKNSLIKVQKTISKVKLKVSELSPWRVYSEIPDFLMIGHFLKAQPSSIVDAGFKSTQQCFNKYIYFFPKSVWTLDQIKRVKKTSYWEEINPTCFSGRTLNSKLMKIYRVTISLRIGI